MSNPQSRYRLISLTDYREYFQTIVSEATFLDGFYVTPEDFIDRGKKDRAGTVLVLENYDNSIQDNQAANIMGQRTGEFYILRQAAENTKIQEVREACELLCYKIIGRIKRDRAEGILETQISNFQGVEMGLITGVRYTGYGFRFDFVAPINRLIAFDEDDWTPAP